MPPSAERTTVRRSMRGASSRTGRPSRPHSSQPAVAASTTAAANAEPRRASMAATIRIRGTMYPAGYPTEIACAV